jgi:mannose-1-phosphate guanylyltransferase
VISDSTIARINHGAANAAAQMQGPAEATASPGETAVETRKGIHNRWAIILAGGEGTRLADLSCRIAGEKTPKQFCRIVDEQSLIERTRQRVELAIPKDRIFYTLSRSHERYYVPSLFDVLLARLVVQPANRGTAPAILYALMRLGLVDLNARVALFPCDHYVSDDYLFMRHVRDAFDVIDSRPDLIVVLGITPSAPEPEYGWIEPASPFRCGGETLFHVSRFIEKPSAEAARGMYAHGRCLWNSFVLVARLSNLLALMIRALPELYDLFAELSGTLGTEFESEAVEKIYQAIAPVDFCNSVLSTHARNHVGVLPVSGLYWNDLGNPSRVLATIARLGMKPKWAAREIL